MNKGRRLNSKNNQVSSLIPTGESFTDQSDAQFYLPAWKKDLFVLWYGLVKWHFLFTESYGLHPLLQHPFSPYSKFRSTLYYSIYFGNFLLKLFLRLALSTLFFFCPSKVNDGVNCYSRALRFILNNHSIPLSPEEQKRKRYYLETKSSNWNIRDDKFQNCRRIPRIFMWL